MLKKILFALSASSLCVAACGGGDGDGGGSGVDGTKSLTTLTDEEIVDICEYVNTQISGAAYDELDCYIDGIFGSLDGGDDCQTIYDECIANVEPEENDCDEAPDDPLPSCASEVTVSEMESCFEAQAAATRNIDISCATTAEEVLELEPETPAACEAVQETCPDLFGDSGSEPVDPV